MASSDRWNPNTPADVSPREYELQVLTWLKKAGERELEDFKATHLGKLRGQGGKYAFDVLVTFGLLSGARMIVLVECKRHKRPVERNEILVLEGKLLDVGAHKGMMFSTAGYQRGALELASAKGIATVTFIDGLATYETRALGVPPSHGFHPDIPQYAGTVVSIRAGNQHFHRADSRNVEAISEYLGFQVESS